jgi:1-deoxy-D-xylulose-5-phosphate synthase
MRASILETSSRTGRDPEDDLGVVDLTIALHRTYDFTHDRLLTDANRLSAPHELLVGECAGPDEAGPGGSSISRGLGMAAGDHLAGEERHTVVLVDASATGAGLAFEALNHSGDLGHDLLVVVNDNRMEVSRTTGALMRYLSRFRAGQVYQEIDKDVSSLLSLVPVIGERMERGYEKLKDVVKAGMMPGQLYEDLGFRYYGPIDGHDLDVLLPTLRDLRSIRGPRVLYVRTKRARADGEESAPGKSGSLRSEPRPSWTRVLDDTLVDIARRDPTVVAITGRSSGHGLRRFRDEFAERTFDVGTRRQHAVGLAAGFAAAGIRPVLSIESGVLRRCLEAITLEAGRATSPIVLCLDGAGANGSADDLALLRVLPGVVLMAPKDLDEMEEMVRFALETPGLNVIRYPRSSAAPPLWLGRTAALDLGRSERLREGPDGAILAYGSMVAPSLDAATDLAGRGVEVTVVNARFCRPLDGAAIDELLDRHPFLVTVEEHAVAGGLGSAVLEHASRRPAPPRIRLLGIPDRDPSVPRGELGDRAGLLADLGLDASGIAAAVEEMIHAEAAGPWQ